MKNPKILFRPDDIPDEIPFDVDQPYDIVYIMPDGERYDAKDVKFTARSKP